MPASQKVQLHQLGVYAEVEPLGHDSRLFFTDEKPKFERTIHNEMDGDIGPESEVRWGIGIGEGRPRPHIQESRSVKVPAQSSRTYEVGGELLALEGHCVFGVKAGSVSNPQGDERSLSSQDAALNARQRRYWNCDTQLSTCSYALSTNSQIG
ncbi:hypothetical protein [Halorubrum sp. SP9]|uniref:hypothetical protein n=1 Tax=Halorubrum sp. SP9 TaxID=1537267 RepID=UPI0010F5578A|nr:hypothetical protein [Halorubrum sp. SP9]TKX69258.1 hypothetical protein EXE45_09065 [Halorubrum sp. SP9]